MNHMNITDLDITDLSNFYQLSEEQLLQKSVAEILAMRDDMRTQRVNDEALRRAQDNEYIRIVKKYLTIYPMLAKYWTDADIIPACAKHASVSDIVQNRCIPVKQMHENPQDTKRFGEDAEYIRTSYESVPLYARNPAGEQLLIGTRKNCHVYRVKSDYQGLRHGNIILELLYHTYPELKEFEFEAYEYRSYDKAYEIYPKINVYTPFDALMSRDINAIIDRNMSYAKIYNAGIYTPDKTEKWLASDEVKHYFHIIENLKPISAIAEHDPS